MADQFDRVLAITLKFEGGYADHPRDPGGATNQGVTQATYDGFRARQGHPARDVRKLTEGERDAIYREGYWEAVRGDHLPAGVDLAVFDGGVNSGPSRAATWLQTALGSAYSGTVDGVVGPKTMAAVKAVEAVEAARGVCERRLRFVEGLSTWEVFGRGWARRIGTVKGHALAWAGAGADDIRADADDQDRKADAEDTAGKGSGAGGGAAGGGGALTFDSPELLIAAVVAAVLLIGVGAALWWRARTRREAAEAERAVAGAALARKD